MNIETVKIKSPDNKRLDWRIINKSKFDPAIHKIWTEGEGEQPKTVTVSIEPQPYTESQVQELAKIISGDTPPTPEPKKRGRPAKGQE